MGSYLREKETAPEKSKRTHYRIQLHDTVYRREHLFVLAARVCFNYA